MLDKLQNTYDGVFKPEDIDSTLNLMGLVGKGIGIAFLYNNSAYATNSVSADSSDITLANFLETGWNIEFNSICPNDKLLTPNGLKVPLGNNIFIYGAELVLNNSFFTGATTNRLLQFRGTTSANHAANPRYRNTIRFADDVKATSYMYLEYVSALKYYNMTEQYLTMAGTLTYDAGTTQNNMQLRYSSLIIINVNGNYDQPTFAMSDPE